MDQSDKIHKIKIKRLLTRFSTYFIEDSLSNLIEKLQSIKNEYKHCDEINIEQDGYCDDDIEFHLYHFDEETDQEYKERIDNLQTRELLLLEELAKKHNKKII